MIKGLAIDKSENEGIEYDIIRELFFFSIIMNIFATKCYTRLLLIYILKI